MVRDFVPAATMAFCLGMNGIQSLLCVRTGPSFPPLPAAARERRAAEHRQNSSTGWGTGFAHTRLGFRSLALHTVLQAAPRVTPEQGVAPEHHQVLPKVKKKNNGGGGEEEQLRILKGVFCVQEGHGQWTSVTSHYDFIWLPITDHLLCQATVEM